MDKPQSLVDAEQALARALRSLDEIRYRIWKGERYLAEHPSDLKAKRLLSDLKVAKARMEGKIYGDNGLLRQYEQIHDMVGGRRWGLEDETHEMLDQCRQFTTEMTYGEAVEGNGTGPGKAA